MRIYRNKTVNVNETRPWSGVQKMFSEQSLWPYKKLWGIGIYVVPLQTFTSVFSEQNIFWRLWFKKGHIADETG